MPEKYLYYLEAVTKWRHYLRRQNTIVQSKAIMSQWTNNLLRFNYSSLGTTVANGEDNQLLNDFCVKDIAAKHDKTPAQVSTLMGTVLKSLPIFKSHWLISVIICKIVIQLPKIRCEFVHRFCFFGPFNRVTVLYQRAPILNTSAKTFPWILNWTIKILTNSTLSALTGSTRGIQKPLYS